MFETVDAHFEDIIQERNYGTLTLTFNKADLENIKTFYDFSSNPIVDITGLDKFTGLESLKLNNSDITDISALENLTNLKILDLSNNKVSDISALENLTNLQELNFLMDLCHLFDSYH